MNKNTADRDVRADLREYLLRIQALIPEARHDEFHAIVGELVTQSPAEVMRLIGVTAEQVAAYPPRRDGWKGKRNRSEEAAALVRYTEFLSRPNFAPTGETEAEARVRTIERAMKLCRMHYDSGIFISYFDERGVEYRTDAMGLWESLRMDLIDAHYELKRERGDL